MRLPVCCIWQLANLVFSVAAHVAQFVLFIDFLVERLSPRLRLATPTTDLGGRVRLREIIAEDPRRSPRGNTFTYATMC